MTSTGEGRPPWSDALQSTVFSSRLPERIRRRLRIPVIAAPMLGVSGPDLVTAACRAGVIGAFPTKNARSSEELEDWMTRITADLADHPAAAPVCPNIIIRDERLHDDVACVVRHGVEMVITSVGSPKPVIPALRDAGVLVFADIASVAHAQKAIDAGADGLILLTAGAGGQTGWLNPFAFVRAVRAIFDGPIVLAGGISDGVALRAAEMLGCDLAYMGTKFIATRESLASEDYRQMLVESSADDVLLTRAFNGLWGSFLRPSIVKAGLDPDQLDEQVSAAQASKDYGSGAAGPRRWTNLWSAGHSVSGIGGLLTSAELVEQTAREYAAA